MPNIRPQACAPLQTTQIDLLLLRPVAQVILHHKGEFQFLGGTALLLLYKVWLSFNKQWTPGNRVVGNKCYIPRCLTCNFVFNMLICPSLCTIASRKLQSPDNKGYSSVLILICLSCALSINHCCVSFSSVLLRRVVVVRSRAKYTYTSTRHRSNRLLGCNEIYQREALLQFLWQISVFSVSSNSLSSYWM